MKRGVVSLFLMAIVGTTLVLAYDMELAKANEKARLSLKTDKNVYSLGENVTIILTNIGNETIVFGGWPPWIIYTYPEWKRVYPEDMVYLAWDLVPGESVTLSWNQFNELNKTFVDPGRYVVYEHNYDNTVFFDIASSASCVADDLNITLTVSNPRMVVGKQANITIAVTNLGTQNVTLHPTYGPNVFDIIVFNETFSWRWSDGMYWIMIVFPPIVLLPGETYVEQKEWNLYIHSKEGFVPPAPGNYTLAVVSFEIGCTPMLQIQMLNPTIKADVRHDGIVDIFDVVIVAKAFGSAPGDLNWNLVADLVQDCVIDIFDVVAIAADFGKTV